MGLLFLLISCSERISEFFDALADRRRRYILYSLQEADTAVPAEQLAEEIAAKEQEQSGRGLLKELKQEIHTELVHNHLPKLHQTGVIAYDHRTGDVRYQDPPQSLQKYLELSANWELDESDNIRL